MMNTFSVAWAVVERNGIPFADNVLGAPSTRLTGRRAV